MKKISPAERCSKLCRQRPLNEKGLPYGIAHAWTNECTYPMNEKKENDDR